MGRSCNTQWEKQTVQPQTLVDPKGDRLVDCQKTEHQGCKEESPPAQPTQLQENLKRNHHEENRGDPPKQETFERKKPADWCLLEKKRQLKKPPWQAENRPLPGLTSGGVQMR